jgi:hypothetical protein
VAEEKKELSKSQVQDRRLRCPTCAAFPRLTNAFLDPNRGKSIRLYECEQCGERIWED